MTDVRINVPPRLIESARAAQYANRAKQGNKELQEKIKRKIKLKAEQQQARQDPLGQKREGGQLEFEREKGQKIWTRRRLPSVGWLLVPTEDFSQGKLKGFLYSDKDLVAGSGLAYIGDAIEYDGSQDKAVLNVDVSSIDIKSDNLTIEFLVRFGRNGIEPMTRFSYSRSGWTFFCPGVGGGNTQICNTPFVIEPFSGVYETDVFIGYDSSFTFSTNIPGVSFTSFYSHNGWYITLGDKGQGYGNSLSGKWRHVAFDISNKTITSYFDGLLFDKVDYPSNVVQVNNFTAKAEFMGKQQIFSRFRSDSSEKEYRADYFRYYDPVWVPDGTEYLKGELTEGEFIRPDGQTKVIITATRGPFVSSPGLPEVLKFNSAIAGNGFSGLRLTVDNTLYRGNSFTPPESITSLA